MTSHPVYDDDDYHESVSRSAPPDWANSRRPATQGSLWALPRGYSAFSARSLTGPYRGRHERIRTSSSYPRCLITVVLVVGVLTLLSIIAVVFIATVGLNNLTSKT